MRTATQMREAQRNYQAAYRQRIKETGRKAVTVYVTDHDAAKIKRLADRLNSPKTEAAKKIKRR